MAKNVDIKVRTVVDSSDLDELKNKLSNFLEKIQIGADTSEASEQLTDVQKKIKEISSKNVKTTVDADAKSAIDKLREVQKKAKEIAAEKTLVNIGVATKGLQDIEKIKYEYEALKNRAPPNLHVKIDAEAEGKIDVIRKKINDLDGLSPQIKAIIESGAIDELQAIQTAADNLDGLSPKIKPVVDDSEALGALQNIQNQSEGLGGLESGITGVLGTVGAGALLGDGVETATNMDKAWRNWVGSLQQSGLGLDQAKKKADGFYKTVNKLASEGQSSDSLFKNVAGLVINLNNQVSDSTLGMTEKVIAGYEMLGGRTGATMYEMEKELKNFLSTGDLGLMEDTMSSLRDPAKWKGLLEGADTVDERIKVLNDMLAEEGIMGALNIDAPSKSIDQLKALFDASMTNIGTTLINVIKPIADGFMWLDEVTGGVSTNLLSTVAVVGLLGVGLIGLVGALGMVGSSFVSTLGGIKNFFSALKAGQGIMAALKGGGMAAETAQLSANTAALTANTAALEANNLARVTASGGSVAKGLAGGAAKGISQIGAVGSAASSAAPGAAAGATGLSAISASITSMLVPLLAISAVIAIMIPIVAGLAVEVLLFVRVIGEVVKALGFDKLNLKPAIGGIKQIGLAMFELSKAFAALTLVNMVGLVYTATGGILGTGLALGQFWLAVKGVEAVLKDIDKLNINPSVVAKITMLKTVLTGISSAMNGMSGLNLSGFGVMLTGGVEAVKVNFKNLGEIAKTLNEVNIPDVGDKSAPIQALAGVLKNVQAATEAVNNSLGWFNEKSLQSIDVTNFRSNLAYLGTIADEINASKIPNVGDKSESIKSMAGVLNNIKTSVESVEATLGTFGEKMLQAVDVEHFRTNLVYLGTIADAINAQPFSNVSAKTEALNQLKTAIVAIKDSAVTINKYMMDFIALQWNTDGFKTAINELYGINQHLNTKAFNVNTALIQSLTNLKTVIQRIGEIGLFISQNTGNIGSYITDNAGEIKTAINGLYSINQSINSKPFMVDAAKVEALNNLKTIIQRIGEVSTIISTNLTNLQSLSANSATISGAIQALYSINQQINSMPFQVDEAKTAAINSLKTLIQSIINTLNAAAGVKPAAQNMGSQITTGFKAGAKNLTPAVITVLTSAINAVKNRYDTMRSAGNALGAALAAGFKSGAGINSPMAVVVSGMSETLKHINSLTSKFESAGHALGSAVQDSYRAQHKSTTEAGYSKLINEVRSDVVNLFNGSGFSWGGSVSAAGGGVSDVISAAGGGSFELEHSSSNAPNITINSAVMSQEQIDIIWDIVQKGKAQNDLRVNL